MTPFPAFQAASDDKPSKADKNDKPSGLAEQLAFKSRFVLVFGEIDDKLARQVCERLILLAQDSDAPIQMLISSPGGHVESGDAVHDMIRFVRAPVTCIGTGWVASAATHIFLAAPKERRVCLPNTRFMIHQPAGGAGGRATDIAIMAKEIIKTRERMARVIATETGQSAEKVRADMERDYWMTADEAIAYGIASRVVVNQKELG
jgi:ATP-dependent Clp protease protease subunit